MPISAPLFGLKTLNLNAVTRLLSEQPLPTKPLVASKEMTKSLKVGEWWEMKSLSYF